MDPTYTISYNVMLRDPPAYTIHVESPEEPPPGEAFNVLHSFMCTQGPARPIRPPQLVRPRPDLSVNEMRGGLKHPLPPWVIRISGGHRDISRGCG